MSRLVSHPLEAPTVTVEHDVVQPVAIVLIELAGTLTDTVVWPAHARVTVAAAPDPLSASTLTSVLGDTNVNGADVGPAPLKLTLLVGN